MTRRGGRMATGVAAASLLALCGPAWSQAVTPDPAAPARAAWNGYLARGQAETPDAVAAEYRLAEALVDNDRQSAAEKHWRRVADRVRRLNGKGSDEDIVARARWAETLTDLNRDLEAEAVAGPAYVMAMRRFGAASVHTDRLRIALGTVTFKAGRYDLAVVFLQPSFDYELADGQTEGARTIGVALAGAYERLGRLDDQRTVLTRIAGLGDGVGHDGTGGEDERVLAQYRLAEADEDIVATERLARSLLDTRRAAGATDEAVADVESKLALVLSLPVDQPASSPRLVEAEALLRDVLTRQAGPTDTAARAMTTEALAQLLIQSSAGGDARHDEGFALSEQALEWRRQTLGPQHPLVVNETVLLALLYGEAGETDRANTLVEQARAAIAAGTAVPPRQRAFLSLLDAQLAMKGGDPAGAYRRLAEAANGFRDQALSTGRSADARRELDSWSFIYSGQVSVAWNLAHSRAVQ